MTGHKAGRVTITCRAADGSKKYARITIRFSENEMKRSSIKAVSDEMVAAAERIRYVSGTLEVRMKFINRTGASQEIPAAGTLTLIAPDGREIPLLRISRAQAVVKNKPSKTLTWRAAVTGETAALDLTRMDAVIK